MCRNKEDLKWCKAATTWTVPANWTPMITKLENPQKKCTTFINDTDPRGQWIDLVDMMDGKIFQCINRSDENPFSEQKNATDDNSWLELVNSTCSVSNSRRCLGDQPSQCVSE